MLSLKGEKKDILKIGRNVPSKGSEHRSYKSWMW